ncbi:hypothetical protein DFA_10213 [Cavenderia fasciculata]|uniref:Peptide transporter n=1 Tax=Cavenderia fasciculata TaxID=261658 RepID=F4Q9L0_CACFS|nr:uncharacterized protein DFA_10213 [Cavenderia fasciculata]EGG15379.1 hypothetical protein DFA_10213 [Cavenderia fasciculata]|eukprot:XP_004354121.1 hypothetical protein DFA_10213 [Cavenderia fasciculata]
MAIEEKHGSPGRALAEVPNGEVLIPHEKEAMYNQEMAKYDKQQQLEEYTSTPTISEISITETISESDEAEFEETDFTLPPQMKFIMGNELCERFSYYGLKTILQKFLIDFMGYNRTTATNINHAFNFTAYAFPVLGAWLADEKLGKFNTILYFTGVYVIGTLFLTFAAVPAIVGEGATKSPWALTVALLLISVGTGGIKPVVSTFCGDQVDIRRKKLIQKIFNIFYWMINLGSLFSTLFIPIIRDYAGYWVAFLIPACLMGVALLLYTIGKKSYVNRPMQGSVFVRVCKVVGSGIKEKFRSKRAGYDDRFYADSWVDRAKVSHDPRFVDATKAALRVCLVFVPMPIFWALYTQTSTIWVDSGERMNTRFGSVNISADMMQAVNPLLILILVPFFEYCIYRPIAKTRFNFSQLRRMVVGMWLCVIAFLVAMIVEMKIQDEGNGKVSIGWQVIQYFILTCAEILVSISSMEFAYAQAPASMKSMVMAVSLLSTSVGQIFVIFVVSLIKISDWKIYLLFACLMAGFNFFFMWIAYIYKPIDPRLLHYMESASSMGSTMDESEIREIRELDNMPSDISSNINNDIPMKQKRVSTNMMNEDIITNDSSPSQTTVVGDTVNSSSNSPRDILKKSN